MALVGIIWARKPVNILGGTVSKTNGTRPWDRWDPLDKPRSSLRQTGHFLVNRTVNSPFCPVCPWRVACVPGTTDLRGASEKCLWVSCLLFFGGLLWGYFSYSWGFSDPVQIIFDNCLNMFFGDTKTPWSIFNYCLPCLLSRELLWNASLMAIHEAWGIFLREARSGPKILNS